MKRVFLVDDHSLIRRLYSEEIEGEEGLMVCGTAASFAVALEALPAARPDVVLVDISLGEGDATGLDLIRRLRPTMNGTGPRWLVVSSYDDQDTVRRAQEAGADGFLSKRDASDELLLSIWEVLDVANP